jgi:hypothetical protein
MQDRGHLQDVLGGLAFGGYRFVLNSCLQFRKQSFLKFMEMVYLILQKGVAFKGPFFVERLARRLWEPHMIGVGRGSHAFVS